MSLSSAITPAYARTAERIDKVATSDTSTVVTASPALVPLPSWGAVGAQRPAATDAVCAPAGAARRVPIAAGWGGPGFLGRGGEHPGGEAEQCQARVAQEAVAPETDLGEALIAEFLFEGSHQSVVNRHARSPFFALFLVHDLHEVLLFRRTVSHFHERNKVGGALVQVGFSGYGPVLDLQDERCAL